MEIVYRIIALLGGLALFLYGMRVMGDGLKSGSSGVMKTVLSKVTDHPAKGFLLGAVITCMIQSSTATIVLTVGLVGAGVLTFRQSTGIVLGANVGTAITAQIIRLMDVDAAAGSPFYFFKADNLAPTALIIGIILIMFVHKQSAGVVGTICMGFGMLFVGLMNMSNAVDGMSEQIGNLLVSVEGNYLMGFLTGVLVTGIIQSSSAVVGILQSIASSMGVVFYGIITIIIGVNIGDCLTTYLVCRIGAKPEQVRVCLFHIVYNVCAAVLLITGVWILRGTGVLNDTIWYAVLRSGGVANVHGLFRLIPAVVLLPLTGTISRVVERIVPKEETPANLNKADLYLQELDLLLINNPAIALDEAARLISHMSLAAVRNYDAAYAQISSYDTSVEEKITEREQRLDRLADAGNKYLVAISPHILLEKEHRMQSYEYKALVCFERIGDLAVNIANNARTLRDNGKQFSNEASEQLQVVNDAIREILRLTVQVYQKDSIDLARRVEPFEEVIDSLVEWVRDRHMARMTDGRCDVLAGVELQNILLHMERIADQCSDLAVYLLSRDNEAILGKEHQYLHNVHNSGDAQYQEEFNTRYQQYFGRLK